MDGYFEKVAKNAQVRADLRNRVHVPSAQTSHPSYQYKSLAREGEFRLIKFINFSSDKPVIELNHVHVDQILTYRSLSYTWGNESYTSQYKNPETDKWEQQSPKDAILIRTIDPVSQKRELGSLSVTKNCAEALWRLYADNPHVPVWIDAICINQQNVEERNHQIGLMEIIYRGAVKVQVYIGADDIETHSEEAMKYLERNFRSILNGHENPFEKFGYVELLPRRVADAIAALLERQWFNRVWVLQEVQSAKYAEIICGRYKIPWLALRIVAPSFYNTASSAKFPPILDIAEGGLRSKDLLTLLRETRSLHATDPRDKVYAMLTLAYNVTHSTHDPEVEEPYVLHQIYSYQLLEWLLFLVQLNMISSDDILPVNIMVENVRKVLRLEEQRRRQVKTDSQKAIHYDIIPNYTSNIYSIYSELARRTINSSENLHIFDEIIYGTTVDLPSWVPDWSMENKRITLSQEAEEEFSASGEWKFEISDEVSAPLEILARGKLLGRVEYTNYSHITTQSSSSRWSQYAGPLERPLFFEILQQGTGLASPSEEWALELADESATAHIVDWIAGVFGRSESLAILRIMLNIGIEKQNDPLQRIRRRHEERATFGGKPRNWYDDLERELQYLESAYEFKTADGLKTYRKVGAIDSPQPSDFANIGDWVQGFRQQYEEKLLKLKLSINEDKILYTHLIKRLEANITDLYSPDLPELCPPHESIWVQKRDIPKPIQNPRHSTYAIVDEKLFSSIDEDPSQNRDEDDEYFRPSRYVYWRDGDGRYYDRTPSLKSVSELEPELESELSFLKTVLHGTLRWINKLKRLPERLRNLDNAKISTDRVSFAAGDYQGLGSKPVECGDIVCVLLGGRVPYVLRPNVISFPIEGPLPEEASGASMKEELFPRMEFSIFRLVGECYVEGIMHGEVMKDIKDPNSDLEWFTLK